MTNSPILNVVIGILLAISVFISVRHELNLNSEITAMVNELTNKLKGKGASATYSAKDSSINQCIGVSLALSKQGFALSAGTKPLKTQHEQAFACHHYAPITVKHNN